VSVVNPEIVAASDWDFMTEGCLSLPGVNVDVKRMSYLEVRGQNPQGKDIHIKTDGLQARVLQHEIDHLNGVLICDYDNEFKQKGTFKATEIEVGYHPDGFRIDKKASPLNFYTHWEISHEGEWKNPAPVCFDSLPAEGWIKNKYQE